MLDLIEMWKNPKMVGYFALTAALYAALLFPLKQFSFFSESAEYLRIAMCIPVAFSFMFGPAAAWGAAFGNLILDVSTAPISWITPVGFLGNFLIAYLPYKLWSKITLEKPDLKSVKKLGLFCGLCALACVICGLLIGWGLLYLFATPFVMTSFTIFTSDLLWAILLGPVLLRFSYDYFSKNKLLYSDLIKTQQHIHWNKPKTFALLVFVVAAILCFIVPALFSVDAWVILPFVMLSLISVAFTIK
jgi:energy-coupling factor transport system substrate-specific component